MKTSFQALLLDPHSTAATPVTPINGENFRLKELYELLDCHTVEVVPLTQDLILIVDEEGKFRNPAYLNLLATYAWHKHVPQARGVDSIVGKAILCHTSQFR